MVGRMPFWEGNNSVSQISTTTTHDVGVGFLFNTNKTRVIWFFPIGGLIAMKKCPGSLNGFEEWPKDYTKVQIDDYWNEPWLFSMYLELIVIRQGHPRTNSKSTTTWQWQRAVHFCVLFFCNVTYQIHDASQSVIQHDLLYIMFVKMYHISPLMSHRTQNAYI